MALVSLKPSSKGVTMLVILAAAIFFGCVLAYMGAAGKSKAVAAELNDKEEQVANSEKIALTLQDSRLRYLDTQSQIRYLESSVSTQAYVPTLLKQFEQLGKSVGLKVLAVRPEIVAGAPPTRRLSSGAKASEGKVEAASEQKPGPGRGKDKKEPVKPYNELQIELELDGKFMNALDFLHGLTSFPKIIAVDTMELAPACVSNTYASPTLSIRMKVTAFVLKDGTSADAPQVVGPSKTSKNATGKGRTENEAG